uniref:Gypsy retrotransposon integrase-like protein 1 n=2 Tax=Oryzias latipes TaxID=8090 RepID=A0A3P9HB43_ORYLA
MSHYSDTKLTPIEVNILFSWWLLDEQLYYNHRGNLRLVVFQAQVCDILRSCHDDIGSGGHHGRRRTLEKVLASYHWKTAREDVMKWVDECPRCQHHETVKTVAPILHPIQVQEAWSVLGIDLIGPLPTTAKGKRFILTATDLFTKWVVAKSLYTKTATEVSRKIVNILLDFGLVERIITDQGREFVNEVNRGVFEALGVKHCITSAYHPQANGQDERTNRNIKTGLSKYCGEDKNDWDIHLRGIVAGINTAKQRSTRFTPYCALFGRHPRTAGVINVTQEEGDDKDVPIVEETEEHLEAKIAEVADLHAKIYQNIKNAQQKQKMEYETRKKRNVKSFIFKVGDEVLKANKRKEGRKGGRLEPNWSGPYVIASISEKGVATLSSKAGVQLKQNVNVSHLKPFISPKLRESKGPEIVIPQVDSFQVEQEPISIQLVPQQSVHDHDYWPGLGYLQELSPVQAMLLNYVLDESRSGTEILVKDGDVCLTREDFQTLGLSQCMESNIGNACFKLIKEAAQRHGKDVHIVDMYVVPTWKSKTGDPMASLPWPHSSHCSRPVDNKVWQRHKGFSLPNNWKLLWYLHLDVCAQHEHGASIFVHREGHATDSQMVVC